ncbi:23S rRNA (adenine(2030)-N(6))-methyltransferase RlmJ [Sinimarinibacterium sp. CAU 1509]|uniref:23S rRNA (adenine(2030)-N(6))-methyltransferase RlmJ n=1 Tax=Sinimarinibacterium sp. CAU 1509 TaxID=2562283 RepID=UPI00146B3703|nr:23S rRNA (adenine(2030)-N(6))-methyltransferase RlmJ [Sinimarinibacterium sp. CAU 1509]
MHYQHQFHAGNFADVFKHVVLLAVVDALNRKPGPWCYFDTHAGAGDYDLRSDAAQRTDEAASGVARLWTRPADTPLLQRYLDLLHQYNPDGSLRHYPGSPRWVAECARADDRLVLCERQPAIATVLRQNFRGDRRVAVHQRDGYEAPGLLPPREKRGMVLIDPPFERPDEFRAVSELLRQAAARFAHGVYLVWYPLKNRHAAERLPRAAATLGREGLDLHFDTGAPAQGQMHACGMLLLNPPFGLKEALAPTLDALRVVLAQGPGAAWTAESF